MALTYTPDELNQLRTGFQAQRAPAPTATSQGKGNFFTHMLPSAGGIAGGAAGGALAGATIGSVIPVAGTAVGGLLGALLGGAVGGGLGKVGENAIEHQGLGHDVAKEAAINGIFSAGPLRLLKGVGTAGKVLAGIGDNSAAAETAAQGGGRLMQALNAGGVAGMAPSAFKTAIANKLDNAAATASQKGLKINDSSFLSNFNKQTGGESVGDFARRFGVPHNGLESTVRNVLQPGFAAHAAAVGSIGDIAKSDVLSSIKSQVAKELGSKVPDSQAFGKSVIDKAQSILDNFGDTISPTELNAVKTELASQVNHAATDTASRTGNEVLNRVSSGLRHSINTAADKAGITVDPALAKLGFKSTNVGDLGNELNNLKTLLDKSEVKSWQGTGTNPISLSGSAALGGFGGPAGLATGLGIQAVNSSTGKKLTAKGIDAVASRLDKAAVKSGSPYTVGNIAKRVAPVGLLGALGGSQSSNAQMTTDPSMNSAPNSMDSLSQNSMQNASATNGAAQQPQGDPNSPLNPANVEQGVQAILANGGKMSDVTAYVGLVKTLSDLKGTGSAKPLNSTQQQQAFNAQSGLSSLNDIAAALQKNPNEAKLAALPGGGLTSSLTGTGSYKAAIANATDVIGRLRSGGAIGQEEEKQFKSLLPQTFDTPQTAAYKLNQLNQLFSQFANPQAAASDQSTLLSSLGAL